MFIENKYLSWYRNIISQAQRRVNIDFTGEKHHIIPRSMGGSNDASNIIKLTPREHFICHLLLARCTDGHARYCMTAAIGLMIKNTSKNLDRSKVTSRNYNLRVLYSRVSFSDEHRRKLSESAKNRPYQTRSSETREKIRQSMLGKNIGKSLSEETKKKISLSKKGVPLGEPSEETKKKISEALTGKTLSEKTKKKISETQLGHKRGPHSEDHKKKISEATKGKKKNVVYSDEERKRRSEAMKALRAKQKLKKEQN